MFALRQQIGISVRCDQVRLDNALVSRNTLPYASIGLSCRQRWIFPVDSLVKSLALNRRECLSERIDEGHGCLPIECHVERLREVSEPEGFGKQGRIMAQLLCLMVKRKLGV